MLFIDVLKVCQVLLVVHITFLVLLLGQLLNLFICDLTHSVLPVLHVAAKYALIENGTFRILKL